MNYSLSGKSNKKVSIFKSVTRILPFLLQEKRMFVMAMIAIIVSSCSTFFAPVVISRAIDNYIRVGDYQGLVVSAFVLLGVYLIGVVSTYVQIREMGGVGRRVLFNLRNAIFEKLQQLPIAFFNQNKTGDLISRINNDTDKLNIFFSQGLVQFVGNVFIVIGIGAFLLILNFKLAIFALVPAVVVFIITRLMSPWVKKRNSDSLRKTGNVSAEIQENLGNFKAVIAFDRADYFCEKFAVINEENYHSAVKAGMANYIFMPIYSLASSIALLSVLIYGIHLINIGQLSIGLLIGFIMYVNNFYNPLRHLAVLWASFQTSLAAFERIYDVLSLKSDMIKLEDAPADCSDCLLEFRDVFFSYPDGKEVLKNINFKLEKGKIYALVGPTGGGKTTTASLMARLYDPTFGSVFLDGKDLRAYKSSDRVKKIGFILQDPFLFTGTVRENILYGNRDYIELTSEQLNAKLKERGLEQLFARFENGLETVVGANGNEISLGQKQLIAFTRATLRQPEILILDEATANIDTVTEQLLQQILDKLPKETTLVIIAHRLNTIENADEIFFVNYGNIVKAGSFEDAVDMLLHNKKRS